MAKLLTTRQVAAACGLSERQFYRLIEDGAVKLPRPVADNLRQRLWRPSDVKRAKNAVRKVQRSGGKPHSTIRKVLRHWETIRTQEPPTLMGMGPQPQFTMQAEPVTDEPYLTADEVAQWLHIRKSQVYDLTRRRMAIRSREPFPCVKLSRKCMRFRRSEVTKWLDEQREAQRAKLEE